MFYFREAMMKIESSMTNKKNYGKNLYRISELSQNSLVWFNMPNKLNVTQNTAFAKINTH